MKKLSIIAALLIISCTKENISKVSASNSSNAYMILAKIDCVCPKDPYYKVWYSLYQTKSTIGMWLVFCADSQHVNNMAQLSSINGDSVAFIRHTGYPDGVGALYLYKGSHPYKGQALTFVLAEWKNLHNLNCSACPSDTITHNPYDTIHIP
jgi:hypothetical protein